MINVAAGPADYTGEDMRLLLQLLGRTGRTELRWGRTPQRDWRSFAAACDYHQVAAIVYCRLQDLVGFTVPPALLEHLRARFYQVSAYNYHLAAKLIELTSRLEQAHISVLAFKGPAAAIMAYGDLALRQYEDLDLLIRAEDVWKTVDLMFGYGFQTDADSYQPTNPEYLERYHAITLEAPDKSYNVDVHWQLARDHARDFGPDIARFWERTERLALPQGSVSTLCREDMFLALCLHGTKHRWGRLKWLLDIAELLRKAETLDWSRVEEMASSRPAARASGSLGVLLARELLEIPVPAQAAKVLRATERTRSVASAIRDEILSRGRTTWNDTWNDWNDSWNQHRTLLGLEDRPVARMKYVAIQAARYPLGAFLGRVSPNDRAFVNLPQRLRFLYFFIRPVRLVVQHGARVARTLWSMTRGVRS